MTTLFKVLTKEETLQNYTSQDIETAKEKMINNNKNVIILAKYKVNDNCTTTEYEAIILTNDEATEQDIFNAFDYNNFGGRIIKRTKQDDNTIRIEVKIYVD